MVVVVVVDIHRPNQLIPPKVIRHLNKGTRRKGILPLNPIRETSSRLSLPTVIAHSRLTCELQTPRLFRLSTTTSSSLTTARLWLRTSPTVTTTIWW